MQYENLGVIYDNKVFTFVSRPTWSEGKVIP